MRERLLVIGGVAAGMSAASAAKRVKPDLEVVVLEKGAHISYGACSLPYYISGDIPRIEDLVVLTPQEAEETRGVKVLTRHEALAIDLDRGEVLARTPEGEKAIPFDRLVLATGGLPIVPPWPGVDLEGVFTLRTLEDGTAIGRFIEERRPHRVVIVGGGYIGMEMSEAFRKRGLEVVVVEKMDRVLGTMDREITEVVERELASQGMELHKETSVEGFGGDGRVREVLTDRGSFAADMVLLAIGVRPNSRLAEEAGIALGTKGAVAVDGHLQTDVPGVYAAGDCAETIHLVTGKKVYIPLGTTANKQGRVAGENAAGLDHTFEGVMGTAVTKVFRLQVARTGLTGLEAEREGYDVLKVSIEGRSRAHACPAGPCG